MNNNDFLGILSKSFKRCLETSERSNEKLKILHWAIAKDLSSRLWNNYSIMSLWFWEWKEAKIEWHYMEKAVDISVYRWEKSLWWIAVKFIMSNYSQNSNNYFENMLWETANLRCNDKKYFQIVILPKHMPYFKKSWEISKIEEVTEHNIDKYMILSNDQPLFYMHTPEKTLFILVDIPMFNESQIDTKEKYIDYYSSLDLEFDYSNDRYNFWDSVIYNDYNLFIEKICYQFMWM